MIEYITYDKKKYPVRVSYRALTMFKKETGVSLENLDNPDAGEIDLTAYETLIYYALESGHRAEKKEFTFKKDEMADVLDDCFFEFVKLIPRFFPGADEIAEKKPVNRAQRRSGQREKKKT